MFSSRVDTALIFKQRVRCPGCNDAFYFTLQVIAEGRELKCPVCCVAINLENDAYRSVVNTVKNTLKAIGEP
jgi:hypothetical protein